MLFQRKFQFDMASCAGVRPVDCDVQGVENETIENYLSLMTPTKLSSRFPSWPLLPHPFTFSLFFFSLSLYIPALILFPCLDSSPSSSSSFLFQPSVLSALICDCAFLPLQSPSPNRYEIMMKLSFLLSGLTPCLKLIPLNTRPHQWKA